MSSEDAALDVSQQQAEAQPVVQEKMVPQSEVDRLVGAVKAKERQAYETQRGQQGGMGGMQSAGFDKEAMMGEVTRMLEERETERKRNEQEQQERAAIDEIAKQYDEKMKQGPMLYDDFKDVTGGFKPGKYPAIAVMAAQMENTPDIIYELRKNPTKLAALQTFALQGDDDTLREEMTKLSKSIKRNEEQIANNTKSPKPLSKLKSSATAGQDTGSRRVSDLRKDPRYRG